MKKHIPNAITSGNILCGCLGIMQCLEGNLFQAVYWMSLGAVCDFLDGFVARALGVSGELGKQLDSLADMVNFGVLPSFILFQLIKPHHDLWAYGALLLAVFSGLRLAKFNIDTRQTDSFIGLPTPACALFVGSLPFIFEHYPRISDLFNQVPYLIIITLILSYLLVAELPLMALKFKTFAWKNNQFRYFLIATSVVLLALFQFLAIPGILFLYILLSLVHSKYTS